MSFSVNETNSNITVTEATTELVVEDRAARVTVSADEMSVEITSPGPQGPAGPGVPVGGVTNDVLVKLSGTQYDTGWRDEITVDQLYFDTGAGETVAVAAFSWDDDDGTVDLGLKGGNVTLHLGQTTVVRVFNDETTTISKGQAVRISGAQGQRPAVLKASATDSLSETRAIGLAAENIAGKAEGWVTVQGVVRGLQTPSFAEGDQLFVGTTAGSLTNTRPVAPNGATQIGFCLVQSQGQGSNGEIYVDVLVGEHLAYLHDVTLTNATSGQVLYNSTTGVWVNKSLTASDVSGVVPSTRTVSASTGLSGGGDLSVDRSFAVLYGTTAGTAAQGNDSRLSDARTPTAHASSHFTGGSDPIAATNIGAVPEGRQVLAGTGLSGGGTLAADRTLSVLYGTTAGTAAQGNDARLSDARTPTAHASSHFTGGSDPIAATNIGAVPEGRQIIAGTALTGGGTLAADRTLNVLIGTTSGAVASGDRGLPTGGVAGQILLKNSTNNYDTVWADRYPLTTSIVGRTSGDAGLSLPNTLYFGQINGTHPASTLCVWPFAVNDSIVVTHWATVIQANSSATNQTLRCGLYQMNSSFELTTLVLEFPTLTVPTGTGNYVTALATPLTVNRGRYAIAWNTSTTAYTFRMMRATTNVEPIFAGASASVARFRSGAEGATNIANALPDPAATASLTIATDTQNWGPPVHLIWSLA